MRSLFLAFFLLLTLSCAGSGYGHKHDFPQPEARNSFVHLSLGFASQMCMDVGKDNKLCIIFPPRQKIASGSGFSVHVTPKASFIMTAGHLCHIEDVREQLPVSKDMVAIPQLVVTNVHGDEYPADIVKVDLLKDLCLLKVDNAQIPELPISVHTLLPGEGVSSVQAPNGFFSTQMVPMYVGYYAGPYEVNAKGEYYALLSASGSSGSPILNTEGEVVGVVCLVGVRFNGATFSPSTKDIRNFLEDTEAGRFEEPDPSTLIEPGPWGFYPKL